MINNGITEHPTDPREPLTADELLHEIVYCKRDGVDNMLSELKKLSIPVVSIPTDIISRLKQKSAELKPDLRELHQKNEYELHSLIIIRNNSFDQKAFLNKKRKPTAKQQAAKRRKLAENQEDS